MDEPLNSGDLSAAPGQPFPASLCNGVSAAGSDLIRTAIQCALVQGVDQLRHGWFHPSGAGHFHLVQYTQRHVGCLILVGVQHSCLGNATLNAMNAYKTTALCHDSLIRFRNIQPLISGRFNGEETLLP